MLNSKLLYTEKDCVVLYHLMICSIDIVTIIFTHIRHSRNLKLFIGTCTFFYVSGFALLTATLRFVHLKYYIFPVAYLALIIGFAGTKCLLTDLLRLQIPDADYSSFCFSTGFLLLFSYLVVGATWPYVLDLVPAFEQPDSYYVSFAGITAFTFLMFLIFNINMLRNVYTFNGIHRETNFKYMVAVLFAPLYYIPKWLFLKCIGLMPRRKRHRSALKVNPYFKFALYGFTSSVVNKMVRIWKLVYLMAPIGFYWAVTEQQHARLVFTTYHTDRRFHFQDREFYLHPTQIQLLNPLSHLIFLPLLCFLIYPAISPWAKRNRIYSVGGMMSFALYFSATIAYRQTKGNTQPLTNRPRRIVTNVVSGLEVNTSLFAKYDIQFGIETKNIDPFSGSSIYAPITNPEVYVNFTMNEESPLEDFSVMTENRQEEYVQTVFFRRKDLWGKHYLEIFNYMHNYIRPYDFMPTFRVYFANVTPLHEVSLLTPLGQRWLSIPMDSTPDVEYHIEPGLYRYTINNFASPDPTINAEYGAYYDAVVYTDGEKHVRGRKC